MPPTHLRGIKMGMAHLLVAAVLLGLYFLPTFIARSRGHRNATAIFALNALAGWTFIGWLAAFIWALVDGNNQGPSNARIESTPARSSARADYR